MTIALPDKSFALPIAGLSAGAVAAATGVSLIAMQRPSRRRTVAQARQLAIYLHHVAMGASVSACARLFERDRATIRHAIRRVEDRRESPVFDLGAIRLEQALATQRDMVLALVTEAEGAAR